MVRGRKQHPMSHRRSLLAWSLAATTAFAGTVCACGVSAGDSASSDHSQSAHHTSAQAPADCSHADDCGDCGVGAAAADRDALLGPGTTVSPEDKHFEAAATTAAIAPQLRIPSHQAPPPFLERPAGTPVQRFDKLLN